MKSQTLIGNLYKIIQTILILVFSLHCLTCGFIAIGLYPTTDSWVKRLRLASTKSKDLESLDMKGITNKREIYVNALYFITTTITTIGYGDIYGVNIQEKAYIILVMFLGILVFTTIQQRVRSIESDPTRKIVIM